MKLLRWGPKGYERPGLQDPEGVIRDLSGVVGDIAGDVLSPAHLEKLKRLDLESLPIVPQRTRLGAPVAHVGKFLCVGLNYSDHAAESGIPVPEEPIIFGKATSAISGPDDDVVLPRNSLKADWEVELGVVIGSLAQYVPSDQALEHVAGYVLVNDLSERAFQLERGGQWIKGKSSDTFGPIGPWLVTRDEIPNPQNLWMRLDVNDKRYQNANTSTMVFTVAHLVSYMSQFMSLQPGDIISTGTPPGVGLGQKPPVYLRPGDTITLAIEGLGTQRQNVRAF